jgi:nucleoside-diphosphate-sugar epimerase
MRILVSGSSGLVGSALRPALAAAGDEVGRLVRPGTAPASHDVAWDPAAGRLEPGSLEGFDAVVHPAAGSMGRCSSAGPWRS